MPRCMNGGDTHRLSRSQPVPDGESEQKPATWPSTIATKVGLVRMHSRVTAISGFQDTSTSRE